ncbi:MAG: tRNA preQ1(34) S-adenosylmethionine ribosyltransferase-isomerase QueA [Phycisphaerales bacterium JB041]
MLRTDALDYHLPPDRIATHAAEPRDAARLMVIRREQPDRYQHAHIRDLPELLAPGDRLVVNTTRVLPARFRGTREDTGGKVEGLYLEDAPAPDATHWVAMLKSRRHARGAPIRLLSPGGPSPYTLRMLKPQPDPPGAWTVEVLSDDPALPRDAPTVLNALGLTPLPPYILSARRAKGDAGDDTADRRRYQTVYAGEDDRASPAASVAAPTAGLHFTPRLLDTLTARGIARTDVRLHVGAGTFKSVETEHVEDHPIHAEWCSMRPAAVGEIRQTRAAGHRVVAIGTTSVRTIESYAAALTTPDGPTPDHLSTRLLLTPGTPLRWTDALLTNFHLPRSTLMALVGAMLQAPDEPAASDGTPIGIVRLKAAYREAIDRGYRFYSFGDAMLVL